MRRYVFEYGLMEKTFKDPPRLFMAANTANEPDVDGARLHGMSYSRLMGALHKNEIDINRKVLADLAMNHPEAFKAIVDKVK